LNDQQLVALCKKGDRLAFEELINRYYLPLYKFFYKHIFDPKASEDLTHDVVIKLIENIDKYRSYFNSKFSTWLFKIAYNTYLDYVRKRPADREAAYEEAAAGIPCEKDMLDRVVQQLDAKKLKQKIDELPAEMKSLIVLRYFKDFSYSDIGKIMGMGPKTVKWKLHNAMERLKKTLKTAEVGMGR